MAEKVTTHEEVVARMEAAAADAYETQILDLLYDLQDGPVMGFYIAQSEQSDEESNDDESRAIARIDALCEAFGMNPKRVSEWVLSCARTGRYGDQIPVEQRTLKQAERHGVSIGAFLSQQLFNTLPMEGGEDASVAVTMSLRSHEHESFLLRGEGNLYFYWAENEDESSVMSWDCKYTADITPKSK